MATIPLLYKRGGGYVEDMAKLSEAKRAGLRQRGVDWMRDKWYRATRKIVDKLAGAGTQAKRHMSGMLVAVGLALLAIHAGADSPPKWMALAGGGLLFVAWWLGHIAADQESIEGRASDLIEWKREEQAFRRAVGEIWRHLKAGAYNIFASAAQCRESLEGLVDKAGWPDRPGELHDTLSLFCCECLPPPVGHESIIPTWGSFRTAIMNGGRKLPEEFEAVKDILEIWSVALDSGGGRASALKEVIHGLRKHHERSLRLVWFLAIAHTAHIAISDEPDYSFVSLVRDEMERG